MSAARLFEAEPMVHPDVLEAYEQAIRVLRKARIPYRETGGIALNFYGAGRPTKDGSQGALPARLGQAGRLTQQLDANLERLLENRLRRSQVKRESASSALGLRAIARKMTIIGVARLAQR